MELFELPLKSGLALWMLEEKFNEQLKELVNKASIEMFNQDVPTEEFDNSIRVMKLQLLRQVRRLNTILEGE